MRQHTVKRTALMLSLAAGFAACSDGLTTPSVADGDNASESRTSVSAPARTPTTAPTRRPTVTPVRPTPVDTVRRAPCDDGLTAEQIARIRALYNAYLDAIAPDLRLIAAVEQEAREAAQNGASRERIAEILARADRPKAHIAELTARLRAAIHEIIGRNDEPCWVVIPAIGTVARG